MQPDQHVRLDILFGEKPWIDQKFVRMFENGVDITPDVDHVSNRRNCRRANDYNKAFFSRWPGAKYTYYHYDALSGKALEYEIATP